MNTKYPELDKAVDYVLRVTLGKIAESAEFADQPEMPYKAQYILEELIKKLKERV
jgi:hypothetical protein